MLSRGLTIGTVNRQRKWNTLGLAPAITLININAVFLEHNTLSLSRENVRVDLAK